MKLSAFWLMIFIEVSTNREGINAFLTLQALFDEGVLHFKTFVMAETRE